MKKAFPPKRLIGYATLVIALLLVSMAASLLQNVAPALAAHTSAHEPSVRIPGHVVPRVKNTLPVGKPADNLLLHLSVSLKLRNQQALDALLAAQANLASPLYHQYLTPQSFAAQFSPTPATVNRVVAYLQSNGLHVTSIAANHVLIDASTTVATADRAFHIAISYYDIRGHLAYAPSSDPAVSAAVAPYIQSIIGLDDIAHYRPLYIPGQSGKHPHTGPGGGYTPSELRGAYHVQSLLNTGADGTGQTMGLFELDGYDPADITTYLQQYHLGSPHFSNVLVDGVTNTPGAGAIEVELDMEIVSALAPGATQKIYIGPNSASGINDTYNRIVTDDKAKITSISWGLCETDAGLAELRALDTIFKQGTAQGQAFFAASGDSGAYGCGDTNLAVDSPADDPYVVGVGGTALHLGSTGSYLSEAAWSNPANTQGSANGSGGGGGVSSYFPRPAYQHGSGLTKTDREVPDISANADPATGDSVYCTVNAAGCYGWLPIGGTSAAAPLWAGVAADLNQYLAARHKPTLGNASATLYWLYTTHQPYPPYHDVTTGTNLYYSAGRGYDLATGLGTPNAWDMAQDLAKVSKVSIPQR